MKNNGELGKLVQLAQAGDRLSQERLSADVREILLDYVGNFRIDADAKEDVVQEVLLNMISNLGQLKNTDKFTPWLLQITSNIVSNHYRKQKNNSISLSSMMEEKLDTMIDTRDTLLAELITDEFKQATMESITNLNPRYKEAIFLRCYQQLDYAGIGEVMKCSKFSAQTLF